MLNVIATDLPRIMACNGSIQMDDSHPPIESTDAVKNEGNAAHWLAQQIHSKEFLAEELIDRQSPEGIYITGEMVEHLDDYLSALKTGTQVEIDTSFSGENWQVNGRADSITYEQAGGHLTINELKYGWRIVEPEMNWTLLAHAIGFIFNNKELADEIHTITMTVYQPRAYHPEGSVRSWRIGVGDLRELSQTLNNTLHHPSEILNTSDNCHYCPSMAVCPAARKAQMNAIEASEKMFRDDIDNETLSYQLDHLKRASQVLKEMEKAYTELAQHRLTKGEVIDNYGVQHEFTNRQWKDNVNAETVKALTGEDITKNQLITPAQAEKKGVDKKFVEAMTERHSKGVKVVRMDADAKAKKLFNQPTKGK